MGIDGALRLLAKPKATPKPVTTVEYIVNGDEADEEETPGHHLPTRVRGFLHRAMESAEMALADDLEGIEITDEILEAAREAMRAWAAVVGALVEKAAPTSQRRAAHG